MKDLTIESIHKIAQEEIKDVDLAAFKATESWKNKEYWQAILDVGYYEWQRRGKLIQYDLVMHKWNPDEKEVLFTGNEDETREWWKKNYEKYPDQRPSNEMVDTPENKANNWGYGDMIIWMKETYGEWFAFMVLVGKYNQQVNNGGHIQYWDNGYASFESRGFGGEHKDSDLHEMLRDSFRKYKLVKLEEGEIVSETISDFEIELDEERYIEDEYIDPETDEYVTEDIENENYGMPVNDYLLSRLDDKYYELEKWEDTITAYAKKAMVS